MIRIFPYIVLAALLSSGIFRGSETNRVQINPVTVVSVSAASYEVNAISAESIVAAFGTLLATTTEAAATTPLPTTLAGTSVKITDSNGVERLAPLFFVSPNQINYFVPPGTSAGTAAITVTSGDGTVSAGNLDVGQVEPAIFSANNNGAGVPAAVALRVRQDATQIIEPIFQFNAGSGMQEPIPIDLGPTGEKVFLILFLSGIRGAADPNGDGNFNESVHTIVGGIEYIPAFVGAQGDFAGLDQINLELDRSLIGSGLVSLSITSGGISSNLCEVYIAGMGGGAPPAISAVNPGSALAGQAITLTGAGFSATPTGNTVRIGGVEAAVNSAGPTELNVTVPFGAQTGPVHIMTSQGEGSSSGNFTVLTSLSGVVQTNSDQPIPGVRLRVVGSAAEAESQSGGQFLVENPPVGVNLIEVDAGQTGVNPPYPTVSLKTVIQAGRDNPFSKPIVLQQATGPGVLVGNASLTINQAFTTPGFSVLEQSVRSVETGGVIFEVPTDASAMFPDGSTSGVLTLTLIENGRLPINLPAGHFSSKIAQITPFGVQLDPGGRLTFPNTDGFSAGAKVTLFKLDQTPSSPAIGTIVAAGSAMVSADGQIVETAAGAITETGFYFVSQLHPTTTVIGKVVDSDGLTPVRLAIVGTRGRETFTDGTGGFILRDVPVSSANDLLTISASYLRPGGRVDRVSRAGITPVANGVTKVALSLMLPSSSVNQPPVILATTGFIINQGASADLGIVVTDPDGSKPPTLTGAGVSFASIIEGNKPGSFFARLTPGVNTSATNYTLRLTATDEKGATGNLSISIRVNRPPTAVSQTINLAANGMVQIKLTGSDPDGDKLNFIIISGPVNGTLSGIVPDLSFQPFMSYTGADVITYKTTDGYTESAPATITLFTNSPVAVSRKLVYHQITSLDTSLTITNFSKPILSGDGNWGVYAIAPGTQNPDQPNRIFVTGFDGSQNHEVDSYQTYCFCGSIMDISSNGGRIISTDTVRLRIASFRGGDGFDLLALTSGEIKTIRITGDGSRVFFILRRNGTIRNTNTTLERGLYTVNPDGSGLKQIVGPGAVSQLLGVEANSVFPFEIDGPSLDVSEDGSRIIFGVLTGSTRHVLVVGSDGSGMKEIFTTTQILNSIGLNATGQVVAMRSGGNSGIVMQVDGSKQTEITNQLGAFLGNSDTILSADGSKVLFGTTNTNLYSTDGDIPIQLAILSGSGLSAFRLNGIDHSSISLDGRRILFTTVINNIRQLATLELDPDNLGEAPDINTPTATPFFVLPGSGSTAVLTVRVATGNTVIESSAAGAQSSLLFNGLLTPSGGSLGLYDNGTSGGDEIAGDGIFTINNFRSIFSNNPTGGYSIRVRVDITAKDGKHHATGIDILPFFVLNDLPYGAPPKISRVSPTSGTAGSIINIEGENFGSRTEDIMVIFGNRVAKVISASSTLITIKVPADAPIGSAQVHVIDGARSSDTVVFTITDQ